jgi:branched-chain amino acid transport system permease protein
MIVNTLIKELKANILLGAIASLTILIFSGWSGVIIGWLLGTVSSYNRCQELRVYTPKQGTITGSLTSLTLGMWVLVATLIEGVLIHPLSGQNAVPFLDTLFQGLTALLITTLAGTVIGAIQGLPPQKRQQANLITIAFILIIFPFIDQITQTNWIATSVQIAIFVMLALGLNIPVGFGGLLDLGYAAFFAIGAYTTGLLASSHLNINLDFWSALPIAAFVAAISGIILGAPTLRLRGDYLAIVTLGFGEIIPVVFRNLTNVRIDEPISKIIASLTGNPQLTLCLIGCEKPLNLTGGEAGINPINRPWLPFIGVFTSSNYFPWYYLIILLVVGAYFMISRLRDSRLGRAWEAMREDELAASAMGINLVKTKLLAFSMGATFSGFAGAFFAAYVSAIFPSVFDFSVSVIILCMVILGGLGNMVGVILGGIIITSADRLYLPQLAQVLKGILNTSVLPNIDNPQLKDFLATSLDPLQMRLFLFGLTLVIMMIVKPEGLVPDRVHQAELHEKDAENGEESLANGINH